MQLKNRLERESAPVNETAVLSRPENGIYPSDRLESYAEITRTMIAQENARQNERTMWLLQLQGFLFAALVFAWGKDDPLIWLLIGVGILSSLSIGKALHYAVKVNNGLEEEWRRKGALYKGPRIIGLGRTELWHLDRLLLPAYNLPAIFIIAWIIVLWFQTHR